MPLRHRARFALPVLAVLIAACSGDDPTRPPPPGEAPTACFTATIARPQADCPYRIVLLFEASCSADDSTGVEELFVRYDFEDDGTWDTGFVSVLDTLVFDPGPLDEAEWAATCEVRDAHGWLSRYGARIPIPGIGEPPDIVAGRVSFETLEPRAVDVTTVMVGQEFAVDVFATFFGVAAGRSFVMAIEKDGAPFARETTQSFRNPCGGFGQGYFTLDEPGSYDFTVILDADDQVSETDESNNRSSAVLLVVP